jgi:hypothetical protein
MKLSTAALLIIAGVIAGIAVGRLVERKHYQSAADVSAKKFSSPSGDCSHAPDDQWYDAKIFDYQPSKVFYTVESQVCPSDIQVGHRVRVTDAGLKTVFFTYDDDAVLRVESALLLGTNVPQLLVVTASSGTNDREDWHIISEKNGQLFEWTWPNYDAPAQKLLRPGEDFCCKEWDFHLRGRNVYLARGVYSSGEGNCCPGRGGVLVHLKPLEGSFSIASVERISKDAYYHWRDQPFCTTCTLQ